MKFDNITQVSKDARWIDIPMGSFLCTHFDPRSPGYIKIITRLTKPIQKIVERGLLSPDDDRKYAILAFVEHCVHDWKGITSGGVPVPFTQENCIELFTQDAQTFYDLVDSAREIASFAISEDLAKN